MTNYTYVIGDNPYDNVQSWRQKGNGKWCADAPTLHHMHLNHDILSNTIESALNDYERSQRE